MRNDERVDFGIWNRIPAADLICPCDVHVQRVARRLGLIQRTQSDWAMAEELTQNLRLLTQMTQLNMITLCSGWALRRSFKGIRK